MGPLLNVWAGLLSGNVDSASLASEMEEGLIGLGQANVAILFQRRKNLLVGSSRTRRGRRSLQARSCLYAKTPGRAHNFVTPQKSGPTFYPALRKNV